MVAESGVLALGAARFNSPIPVLKLLAELESSCAFESCVNIFWKGSVFGDGLLQSPFQFRFLFFIFSLFILFHAMYDKQNYAEN